ncbi:MAG: hypothetical protein ABSF08_12470 [Candidatus Cybelea sp.]|jgi:hypothetical protein
MDLFTRSAIKRRNQLFKGRGEMVVLFLLGLGIAVVACSTNARAMDAFCPAVVQFMRPSGTEEMPLDAKRPDADNDVQPATDPSTSFVYELASGRMRTIEAATMFADTDHGWFQWNAQGVEMHEVQKWVDTDTSNGNAIRIQSTLLTVAFPFPVVIHHAWVASATRLDESNMYRHYSCLPPAYDGRGNVPKAEKASGNPLPNTVQGVPTASPITTPFALDCKDPFHTSAETREAQPTIPLSAPLNGAYRVGVKVLVGANDDLIDAAIYHSANRADIDAAALSAAKASGYTSAISYCQKVPSARLFWSLFSAP